MKTTGPESRLVVLGLVAVCLAVTGCTATIHERNGETTSNGSGGRAPGGGSIEGRIERSETDTIYLKTADGQTIALGRDRIGDIDHPGNVAVLLSPLPVLGGFSVAAMEAFGSPNGSHTVGNVALVTGLVGGLALAVGGLVVWGGSRTRAANYDRTGPATAPAPGG